MLLLCLSFVKFKLCIVSSVISVYTVYMNQIVKYVIFIKFYRWRLMTKERRVYLQQQQSC
jgi:hypothetical protein